MRENTPVPPLGVRENFLLDDRIRGVPPGTSGLDSGSVASLRWHPAEGRMSLPLLTLDEGAFAANRDLFLRYAREQGVAIAPHAKTPMAPDLARSLVEAGAWGTTVADIRQATVMLKAGLTRLIIANEVGGAGGASRLATLAGAWPNAELFVFAELGRRCECAGRGLAGQCVACSVARAGGAWRGQGGRADHRRGRGDRRCDHRQPAGGC